MIPALRRLASTATLFVLAIAPSACAVATPASYPIATSALFAPPPTRMARVVFLRHIESFGSHSTRSPLHVIDEHGVLLGDLRTNEAFSAVVPAGPHDFFSWHDDYANAHYVAALHATLEAGRTYFVGAVRARHAPAYQTAVEIDLERAPVPLAGIPDLIAVMMYPDSAAHWSNRAASEVNARLVEGRAKIAAGDFANVHPADGVVFNGQTQCREARRSRFDAMLDPLEEISQSGMSDVYLNLEPIGAPALGTAERDVVEAAPFVLPRDYVEAVSRHGWRGFLAADGEYLDLWSLASVLSMNARYEVEPKYDDMLLIGSDGAGMAYALVRSGDRVVFAELPFTSLDPREARPRGATFAEFLQSSG